MTTLTTRVAPSAHLLAATDAGFQGRALLVDRPRAQRQGRALPVAGIGTSTGSATGVGIALDRTPIPRGTPMI